MQPTVDHPDLIANQIAVKAIKRGGRQAADDQAMEAMWLALESGKSREEAEAIFSNTYINILHGNRSTVEVFQ